MLRLGGANCLLLVFAQAGNTPEKSRLLHGKPAQHVGLIWELELHVIKLIVVDMFKSEYHYLSHTLLYVRFVLRIWPISWSSELQPCRARGSGAI